MKIILSRMDKLGIMELLSLHESIKDSLVKKGWAKGYSDPIGYAAEQLFISAYPSAKLASSSVNKGYDLTYRGNSYQIKARVNRPRESGTSRKYKQYIKLGVNGEFLFDVLVFIVFEKDFSVKQAFKINAKNIEDAGIGQKIDGDNKYCLRVSEESIRLAINNKFAVDITDKIKKSCLIN